VVQDDLQRTCTCRAKKLRILELTLLILNVTVTRHVLTRFSELHTTKYALPMAILTIHLPSSDTSSEIMDVDDLHFQDW
jgi:hypothetical protein